LGWHAAKIHRAAELMPSAQAKKKSCFATTVGTTYKRSQ